MCVRDMKSRKERSDTHIASLPNPGNRTTNRYSLALVSTLMSVPPGGAALLKNGSCGCFCCPRRSPSGGGVSTVGGAGGGMYVDSSVFDDDELANDAESKDVDG